MEVFGLGIALLVILVLVNRGINLAVSLALGIAAVVITSPGGSLTALAAAGKALIAPGTVELGLVVALIWILGRILQESGALARMVDALAALFTDQRFVLALIPSIIGLLVVPGGAILSAPMLNEIGDELGISRTVKSAINMLFRHVLHFIYPLSATLIVTARLSEVDLYRLAALGLPATMVGAVLAFYCTLGRLRSTRKPIDARPWAHLLALGHSMSPILLVLFLVIVFRFYFPAALLAGVALALANYLPGDRQARAEELARRISTCVMRGHNWTMNLATVGVMVFRGVLEHSGAVKGFAGSLADLGLPLPFLVATVPFIAGFVTGSTIAAVGLSLAVFLPLYPAPGSAQTAMVFTTLVSATIGYNISPLHLCLVLTNSFFGSNMGRVQRALLVPMAGTLAAALVTAWYVGR